MSSELDPALPGEFARAALALPRAMLSAQGSEALRFAGSSSAGSSSAGGVAAPGGSAGVSSVSSGSRTNSSGPGAAGTSVAAAGSQNGAAASGPSATRASPTAAAGGSTGSRSSAAPSARSNAIASTSGPAATAKPSAQVEGLASWLDIRAGTCASNLPPMGATLTITAGGQTVTCVVVSRGPFVQGRVVDLARSTFSRLGPVSSGLVTVTVSW